MSVIGFDLEPGGTYSVVGLDSEGRLVFKQEGVHIPRLIRIVWEYRPRILACDNIFELSDDESLLRKILSMLPDGTEVVQVTRRPDGSFADIRSVAALAGIHVEGKLSPLKTAQLAALLALKGYGSKVVFTEEKTKIVIAAAHHGSSGGMSQARYQRGIKAGILRATRVIKRLLDKHGFDYDLVFRKSGYGLESAVFIVYAPRSALKGVIRQFRGKSIRVEVRPVYTGRIHFEAVERETPQRYLIVGVDPGTVTAVAAIDLHGRLIFVYSRKGLDRAEIIELIKRHGTPVLIATDVTPAPETVKKLAASLGVPLYTPPTSLTVDEKQELVSSYASTNRLHRLNTHERDALAAALRAYREYMGKFRQIEAHASRYPAEISVENLKASVVRGASIAEAIEAEIERLLVEKPPKPVRSIRHTPRKSNAGNGSQDEHLVEELNALKARLRVLEERLKRCAEEKAELENQLRLVKLDAADKAEEKLTEYKVRVETLLSEVTRLREEVEKMRSINLRLLNLLIDVVLGRYLPAPYIPTLTPSALRSLHENPVYHALRVLVTDSAGNIDDKLAEAVEQARARAVIVRSNGVVYQALKSLLEDHAIPVIHDDNAIVLGEAGIALVPASTLEKATMLKFELEERLRRRQASRESKMLDFNALKNLVESYRQLRMRELADEGNETTML